MTRCTHRSLLQLAALSLVFCAGLMCAPSAGAGCLGDKPLRGVNLAGAEFNSGRIPGTRFKDYVYPVEEDLRYFAELGANTIRLPFRWERLQRTLNGPLDTGELAEIKKVVATAKRLDLCVILDAHNYGTYASQPLGSPDVPSTALGDFWVRMYEAFPEIDNVAFGLMNEPAKAERPVWFQASLDALSRLRRAGSQHLVLVSGAGWSGAHDWMKSYAGGSNADAYAKVRDPLNRTWIEVHQYADPNFSGTRPECVDPARMRAIMDAITAWAKASGQRLFLGEFGVAPSESCLATLRAQLEATRAQPWAGWTYWAAGRWWGESYVFNVQPRAGVTREQLPVLRSEW
jgi:endoglucanase